MGKNRGFIAYEPELAREKFNSDPIIAIYYKKLQRYSEILEKDSDGFFTRSSEQISRATCITRRQQDRVRNWLEKNNLIICTLKIPEGRTAPQIHFKLVD